MLVRFSSCHVISFSGGSELEVTRINKEYKLGQNTLKHVHDLVWQNKIV
jgi:hypothetical protein